MCVCVGVGGCEDVLHYRKEFCEEVVYSVPCALADVKPTGVCVCVCV